MDFKIFAGPSQNLALEKTPFHAGWIYVTTDTGGVYLDVEADGTQNRVCLNPPAPVASVNSQTGEVTLTAEDVGAISAEDGTVDGGTF